MKTLLAGRAAPVLSIDVGWRVLALANVLRLLSPPALALVSRLSPQSIGEQHPALFAGAATAYFLYAVISVGNLRRRWPDLPVQTLTNVCVDVLVISLLAYASGGVSSGLAALMILSVGAASSIVRQRLALLFAGIAAVGWLVQQCVTLMAERGSNEGLLPAASVAALIFIVTLSIRSASRMFWDGIELPQPPTLDVATIARPEEEIAPDAVVEPAQQIKWPVFERPAAAPRAIELTAWLKEFVTALWLAEDIDKRTLRLVAPAHDIELRCDASRLYQLLWRLCEHALEYHASEQPIEIRVVPGASARQVVIELRFRGPNVTETEVELARKCSALLAHESRPGGYAIIRLSFE
jgi:hypothetical protein